MLTEKGQLQIGVEFQGKTHKEFIIRAQKVKDSVEAFEDERAGKNDVYFGLALLSRQIEKLGDIPLKDITPQLLMNLYDVDLKILYQAKDRLEKKMSSFRGEDKDK